jgi:SAM-dependent methyltransferase
MVRFGRGVRGRSDRSLPGRFFRLEEGVELTYLGIDVSPEMIALGRRQHPDADIRVGCFPDDVIKVPNEGDTAHGQRNRLFDCILFNGSLQLFPDPRWALGNAASLLRPVQGSRIVVSHAMGSKFVDHECRTNPHVAVSKVPPNGS